MMIVQAGTAAMAEAPPASIVVTGSRLAGAERPALAHDRVALVQPASALEALALLPGMRAVSTGGIGGTSFVSVRGGDPNLTLILIDGVRVNDPTNSQGGGFDFAQLDPGLIESISLVPTPVSAVHGSDALSGVISVRLLAPAAGRVSGGGRIQLDSREAGQLSARLGQGWDDGGLLVTGSLFDSGRLTAGSDLRRAQGLARVSGHVGAAEASLFALYGQSRRSSFAEASGGPLFAATPDRERRDTRFVLVGGTLAGLDHRRLRPRLTLGWSSQRADLDAPAIPPGALDGLPALASRSRFDRLHATGDLRLRLTETLSSVVGADAIHEKGRSRGAIDFGFPVPTSFDIGRTSAGLFAEAHWQPLPALGLAVAARYDRNRDEGEFTPRIGVTLAPEGLPALSFTLAEGYKLPSLYALADPLIGNPDLRPERSRGFDLSVRRDLGEGGTLSISYFRTRYRDLVDFDVDLFRTVNRRSVVIAGVEAALAVRLGALEGQASVTHLSIESEAALRSRPRWLAAAAMSYRPAPAWTLGLSGRASSRFLEASIPTGTVRLSGRVVLDASVRWQVTPRLRLTGTIANLGDADYQDAVGFPAPGRLARLSLAAGF